MIPPRVVNIRHSRCTRYIGRLHVDSELVGFGNPFSTRRVSVPTRIVETREEAVARHWLWLNHLGDLDLDPIRREYVLSHLWLLRGQVMGCFCAPRLCHGDNYVELIYLTWPEDRPGGG